MTRVALLDEIGRLRAALEKAEAERDRLRVEVRLREESQIPMIPCAAMERLERAEAERDRLAKALKMIAFGEPPDEVWDFNVASSGVEWAGKIARNALAALEKK
jgi:hypothetical protein